MKKIITLGIDGLNGSGKGTQIDLFTKYLDENSTIYFIARGDGIRFGYQRKLYDSHSNWWAENVESLLDKSNDPITKLNLQYQRLSREAIVLRKKLKRILRDDEIGVMLFDRSFVSRYFTMLQFRPNISLEEALACYNPKNMSVVNPIVPDITFVLDVTKQNLIRRMAKYEDSGGNRKRKRIVEENYDSFNSVVKEICESRNDVIAIDGNQSPQEIHNIIRRIYENARAR